MSREGFLFVCLLLFFLNTLFLNEDILLFVSLFDLPIKCWSAHPGPYKYWLFSFMLEAFFSLNN